MNKRYWLKGGIVGLVVSGISFLAAISGSILAFNQTPSIFIVFDKMLYPAAVSDYILRTNFGCTPSVAGLEPAYCSGLSIVSGVLFMLISYFIIGSIIGYIFDKIKKDDQV